MTQQLGLFGNEMKANANNAAAQTGSDYREACVAFSDACDIAAQYGRETAERYVSAPAVRQRLQLFVEGLACANDFDAGERELLRNIAWAAADSLVSELPF
jgi:hypothetical protein